MLKAYPCEKRSLISSGYLEAVDDDDDEQINTFNALKIFLHKILMYSEERANRD